MSLFENDELLIELVKKHSVLYDLGHPRYIDAKMKTKIWYSIGKQLNTDVSICRSRWNNIRDQFRKTEKRNTARIKRNPNSKAIRPYKYSDLLTFLTPFFQERDVKQNEIQEVDFNSDDEMMMKHDSQPGDIIPVETSMSPHDDVCPSPNELHLSPAGTLSVNSPRDSRSLIPSPTFCSVPSLSTGTISPPGKFVMRSKGEDPSRTSFTSFMDIALKNEDESQHPVDVFLAGVSITLKNLSPYYQNLAKSDLFAVVQKYEMQMLMENNEGPIGYNRNISDS